MHPVEPSTMVRGPAALTISFITRADSQPWQVRWPEVKYSSMVTFFTPLKGRRTCVSFVNVVASAMSPSPLLAHTEPVSRPLGATSVRRCVADVHGLVHVFERHLPPAETADEADQRGPVIGVVERGPHLGGHHARPE